MITDAVWAPSDPFKGLHGVFADSLQDGWGRLVLDRAVAADVGVSRKVIQEVADFIGDKNGSVPPPPRPTEM